MQLLTIYMINAICLAFSFLLFPIHWFWSPFSLFFIFPICFSPSVFAEVIWLVQGKRAVAVECVQIRRREESHSGGELHSFVGYTTERLHRGADTVKVLCLLVCVCGCVSIVFGDECKVVLTAALVGIFNHFLFAALKTFSWIEAFLFRDLKS